MSAMANKLVFNSDFRVVSKMPVFAEAVIKNEPMFFSADRDFVLKNCGAITYEFAQRVPHDSVIDSRVHMLMKGWYPCIPGWHLDDVPRTRSDGQPDHAAPKYKAEHILTVLGRCSLTEFVTDRVVLEDVPAGEGIVYSKWNSVINALIAQNALETKSIAAGDVVRFDWQSFHRGRPATESGWRIFLRASWNTERAVLNEIRKQTQVYLAVPEAGW